MSKQGAYVYKSNDGYIFPIVTETGENAFSLIFLLPLHPAVSHVKVPHRIE
jgi:hypothetical protein